MEESMLISDFKELISVYDWLLLQGMMVQDDYSKQVDYIMTQRRLPDAGLGITLSGEAPFVILHLRSDGPAKEAQNQGLMLIHDILESINDVPIASFPPSHVRVLLLGPPSTTIILQCAETPRRSPTGSYRVALRRRLIAHGGDTLLAPPANPAPAPAPAPLPRARAPPRGTPAHACPAHAGAAPGGGRECDPERRFDCAERAVKATYDPARDRWDLTLINVAVEAAFAQARQSPDPARARPTLP
jgi:hypothetical protein